ncbi:MAG: sigma 54-interacting transcriptional regulator [Planctomycetota bacterium]|jgi:transcriptional regulator with GAF, ATPase, and Fis domain
MSLLRVVTPTGERTVALGNNPITMGRSADNAIVLDDSKSSRRHCVVERTPGGSWRVRDLHSMNGTYVNGIPVTERHLEAGDKIEIGKTEIIYEPGDAPAADGGPPGTESNTVPIAARGKTKEAPRRLLSEAVEEENNPDTLREEVAVLNRLLNVNKRLASEHDLDKLLEAIVDDAIALSGAERGFILLQEGEEFAFQVARNTQGEPLDASTTEISRTIAQRVIDEGEPLLTADAQSDQRLSGNQSVRDLQLRSVLCVPLRTGDTLTGALYLDNHVERGIFEAKHVRLVQAFADQATIAFTNARLLRENERRRKELETSYGKIEELNRELAAKVDLQTQELLAVRAVQEDMRTQLQTKYNYDNIVGRSTKMQEIFRLLDRITDVTVPVLIHGESGTGKELIARAIHYNGPRKEKAFVSENCAAISETLLESELFGYVRGAFTGAERNKKGLFEIANGGTLFLDEVGDMSNDMQKKLLRVLQEGQLRPVGGKDTITVDVRIVSATNRKLDEMVREGKFREDLFYRLNVVGISVPPLRDRREDVPLLAERFLEIACKDSGVERTMGDDVVAHLMRYDWPGNVRELENEIRKMVALSPDAQISPDILSPHIREGSRVSAGPLPGGGGGEGLPHAKLKELVEELEKREIRRALGETQGNKSAAAKLLGLSRLGLRKKMERYGIESP